MNKLDKTILIVDDEPEHCLMLEEALSTMTNVKILTSHEAEEGFRWIQQQRVDLLVTDFEMKGLGGEWLISQIRGLKGSRVPILLVSGSAQLNAEKAIQLGADHYLKKPIRVSEFVQIIKDLLNRL